MFSHFSSNYTPHRYCYLAQPRPAFHQCRDHRIEQHPYGFIFTCLLPLVRKHRCIAKMRSYLWILRSFDAYRGSSGYASWQTDIRICLTYRSNQREAVFRKHLYDAYST